MICVQEEKLSSRAPGSPEHITLSPSLKWNEVRPGVRTFALWSLGLLFGICALLIIAENWPSYFDVRVLALALYAGYYVLIS
jgi:hypothetical protein